LAVRLPPVTDAVVVEAAEADPNVLLTAANVPLGVIVGTGEEVPVRTTSSMRHAVLVSVFLKRIRRFAVAGMEPVGWTSAHTAVPDPVARV